MSICCRMRVTGTDLCWGNYDREEDIHKRPLARLVQDVAKELGVI